MPRLPGHESTQKVIALEDAIITSFKFPWEQTGKCCIKGCDHKTSGQIGNLDSRDWCSSTNAGLIVAAADQEKFIGVACPHCVDAILALGER